MELRHLRYFIAVAEELHFSNAAKRLNMAQPPLSKQIHDLESELGARLLNRSSQRVTLTPGGEAFLDYARRLVADADEAKKVLERVGKGQLGRITVGFTPPMMCSVLPAIIARFTRSRPDVEVHLDPLGSRSLRRALRDDHVDVIFSRAPLGGQDIAIEACLREELLVVLPEAHPLAREQTIPLNSLKDELFVIGLSPTIAAACEAIDFRPQYSSVITEDEPPDVTSVLSLVAAGLGISFLGSATVHAISWRGVVFRRLASSSLTVDIVVSRKAQPVTPVVDAFLDTTRQEFALQSGLGSN